MNNLFLTHKILKINKELANITDTINHMINTPEIFGYQDISDFFMSLIFLTDKWHLYLLNHAINL